MLLVETNAYNTETITETIVATHMPRLMFISFVSHGRHEIAVM